MTSRAVPGTPSWLAGVNDRAALAVLLQNGAMTRNELGESLGLSKPTAAQIFSRLQAVGAIEVTGAVAGRRGPSAAMYAIRQWGFFAVAVTVEENEVRASVVGLTGAREIARLGPADLVGRTAAEAVRAAIERACERAQVDAAQVRIACIGLPAAIDKGADELRFVEELDGWPTSGVAEHLAAALGIDVILENDVNLAALAEAPLADVPAGEAFALLWLGEGIGASVVLGGRVMRGGRGSAGEVGYLPAAPTGSAGDHDRLTLQDVAGGPRVLELARGLGVPVVDMDELIPLLADETVAASLAERLGPGVAAAVEPLAAVVDPHLVVLGGPIGRALGERLARAVAQALEATRWSPAVLATRVRVDPVIEGARLILGERLAEMVLALAGDVQEPPGSRPGLERAVG